MEEGNHPEEDDAIDELITLWAELQGLALAEGNLVEYIAVDDQLATSGSFSLEEIAANVLTATVNEPDEARYNLDLFGLLNNKNSLCQ